MEEQKDSLDLAQLIADVYLNYERLNKHLRAKYRTAFEEFNGFETEDTSYPFCYFEFFYSFGLGFRYKQTDAINLNFVGTYSYQVIMDDNTADKLGRSKKDFRYYGINSKEKAVEKLVTKTFEIIDYLLNGREMPDRTRRT